MDHNNLYLEDYHNKIIRKLADAKEALLNSINVTEEQYVKLTTTDKGKEVLKQLQEKEPKRAQGLLRVDMIDRIAKLVEKEFSEYLPF
jgi:hypothetical protein